MQIKLGFGEVVDVSTRVTISIAEAARLLNCKESTVRERINKNELDGGFKMGGRYKINWLTFAQRYGFEEGQIQCV